MITRLQRVDIKEEKHPNYYKQYNKWQYKYDTRCDRIKFNMKGMILSSI